MQKNYKGILIEIFDLKTISTFKIGGKAKYYYIPDQPEDLIEFLKIHKKTGEKFYIIGNGSNILFNDKFYNGTIVNLKGITNYISINKNIVHSGAGLGLNTLIDHTIENSLKGLEKLSGIPGTVGGALIMNAGAFGSEIGKLVQYVKVLTYSGQIKVLTSDKIKFQYRKAVPLDRYILLEVGLKLRKSSKTELIKVKRSILKQRSFKQPLDFPSCGSIFKRRKNNYAGALIEKCGLKGMKIGQAQVSLKHGNFIVNTGHAKANDVIKLIKMIQKTVFQKFKVKLEPEIKFFNF